MNLKDAYTKVFIKENHLEEEQQSIDHYYKKWWMNIRKNSNSLRLTDEGYQYLSETLKLRTFEIDFPKELKLTPQVLIYLDKFIDSPYYITKKTITVFKEKVAFEIYLFSGDVRKLGYTKALAKAYDQKIN